MTVYIVVRTVRIFFDVLTAAILLFCIMSWFPAARRTRLFEFVGRFIEPMVAPFRGLSGWIMRKTGIPLDFSVWFALIGLQILEELIWRLIGLIF